MDTKTAWMEYALHNFVPGTIYTIMSVGLVMLLLPSKVDRKTLKPVLEEKLKELGPITREQYADSHFIDDVRCPNHDGPCRDSQEESHGPGQRFAVHWQHDNDGDGNGHHQ